MDIGAEFYKKYLSGDESGIIGIVTDYKDGLIMYLSSIVRNIDIAEELAEEVFFKLMVKKPHYKETSSFKSWIYAIGRNLAMDYFRKQKYISNTQADDLDFSVFSNTDIEKEYFSADNSVVLHKAMTKLSNDYRQILWLIYFEDFTNKEACITLKKNEKQIRNLIYRAKSALKAELEREGFSYEDF